MYSIKSTWTLPKETGAWGARGTIQTCTAAGFFGQGSSIASPLYNGSLALFYLLTVKYGWRDDPSGAATMEDGEVDSPNLNHGCILSLVFGWGTAIAGLPLLSYRLDVLDSGSPSWM